jgi:hypothetical protein
MGLPKSAGGNLIGLRENYTLGSARQRRYGLTLIESLHRKRHGSQSYTDICVRVTGVLAPSTQCTWLLLLVQDVIF